MAHPAKPSFALVEQQAILVRRDYEKALEAAHRGNCKGARVLYLKTKLLARQTTKDFISLQSSGSHKKASKALNNMFTIQALADMIIEERCQAPREKPH